MSRPGAVLRAAASAWLALLLALAALPAGAADESSEVNEAIAHVNGIEQALERRTVDPASVGKLVNRMSAYHSRANRCIESKVAEIDKLANNIALLGDGGAQESDEVGRSRTELETAHDAMQSELADCRVLALRSAAAIEKLGVLQQSALTEELLVQGERFDQLVRSNITGRERLGEDLVEFMLARSGIDRLPHGLITVVVALIPGVLVGLLLQFWLRRWSARVDPSRSLTAGLYKAFLATSAHYAPYLAGTIGIALTTALLIAPKPFATFIVQLSLGLSGYFAFATLLSTLLAPYPPAETYLPLDPGIQRSLGYRLKMLAVLALLFLLLYAVSTRGTLSEPVVLLLRGIYAPFLALNLIWVTWLISRLSTGRMRWILGPLLSLVALASLAAEWLGFRNLAAFVTNGVVVTLLGLAVIWLASYLLDDLYDGLDKGLERWQRWLRERMGLRHGELMPGVFWLRSITGVVLWGSFILLQLRVWGMSASQFSKFTSLLTDGFAIGNFFFAPKRLLLAVLTLAAVLLFAGWMKRQLAHHWLPKSRLDRGAKEALVTTTGYVGVAVAIVVMLSVAGLEFTNVAIVAGALSVGIGFGLQNVVNNFVSGLILLIERPIKTGDWIVVGATEGYVRRISIRSTIIETFDRADVIVPNSDLISGQVINWMLSDSYGRAKIPVGVAYGSDTERVRDILLQIADEHPDVVKHHPAPPNVFFLGFGDSALNMELRVHIREVDSRMRVISEINFAIDAAFRREGIEIPFPQRDLHVRHMPPGGVANPGGTT